MDFYGYNYFKNQSNYYNYHYNRIKREKYFAQKYSISKVDLEFLKQHLLRDSFDSKNPMINKLYGESIKNWFLNHIFKC